MLVLRLRFGAAAAGAWAVDFLGVARFSGVARSLRERLRGADRVAGSGARKSLQTQPSRSVTPTTATRLQRACGSRTSTSVPRLRAGATLSNSAPGPPRMLRRLALTNMRGMASVPRPRRGPAPLARGTRDLDRSCGLAGCLHGSGRYE